MAEHEKIKQALLEVKNEQAYGAGSAIRNALKNAPAETNKEGLSVWPAVGRGIDAVKEGFKSLNVGLEGQAIASPPIGINGENKQVLGKTDWKNPLSPEPVPEMNKPLFEPPYDSSNGKNTPPVLSVNPTALPAISGRSSVSIAAGGGSGNEPVPSLAQRAEDSIPWWGRKGGWDVVGKKGPNGMGMIPQDPTRSPTVGRISELDRPGKGILGAKLETDTADTTLVSNPNYGKGIVEPNGYGHIDDRKYIEVPNQYKGEKVPLIEAVGFPRKAANPVERIMMNPSSYDPATGKLGYGAKKQINAYEIAKEHGDAIRDSAKINAEAHKAVAKYGFDLKFLEKQTTDDDKLAKDIWERNKVETQDENGVKNIDPTSTFLNIAEQHAMGASDWQKLPKNLQKPVLKVMGDFDNFVTEMSAYGENAKLSKEEQRNRAWPIYKKIKRAGL